MRDEKRIDETLQLIGKLWHSNNCKDLRLWQVIAILENRAQEMYKIDDVWNLEEAEWNNVINDLIFKYNTVK